MGKIICLANQKGGVAKTTTAVNLAAGLGRLGKKTLLVDLDPQGNASSGMGFVDDAREVNIYHCLIGQIELQDLIRPTMTEGVDMVVSNDDLSGAEVELASSFERSVVLRNKLRPLAGSYDFIIIDSPPSLGLLTVNSLTTSDAVLVPLQAEYYAMEGLSKLLKTIELVRAGLNRSLAIEGILITMYDGRNNICRQVEQEIRGHFKDVVFTTVIPRNVRLSEAPSHGLPIYAYDASSRGAESYMELTWEVIRRNGQETEAVPVTETKEG